MQFAAKLNEVPNWGKKLVELNGVQVLLVNVKGEVFACENECPHQGSPLQAGIVKDGPLLSCPRHGFRFNLKTGACSDNPQYTLKLFPVRIDGKDILVDMEKAWAPLHATHMSVLKMEVNPRMISIVPPEYMVVTTTLQFQVEAVAGHPLEQVGRFHTG